MLYANNSSTVCSPAFLFCGPTTLGKDLSIASLVGDGALDQQKEVLKDANINLLQNGLTLDDVEQLSSGLTVLSAATTVATGFAFTQDSTGQILGGAAGEVGGAAAGGWAAGTDFVTGSTACGAEADGVGVLCGFGLVLAGGALGGWFGGEVGNQTETEIKRIVNS